MTNYNSIGGKIAALAVAVAVTLFAAATYAQPAGGGGRGGGFALDDQQRTALREALQKDTEAVQKLDEKLRAAQKELMKVVLAEKQDEAQIKEKAEAVAKIQTEMIMIRAKAWGTISPTMKPDQREQMIESRFGVMMLQGGFGGPGSMAPGGRGQGGPGGRGQGGPGGGGGRGGGGGGQNR